MAQLRGILGLYLSQIMWGYVWTCQKFHAYLYGLDIELWTDHKPVELT